MSGAAVSVPSTWRPTSADPREFFDDEELERARRYQRPLRRASLAHSLISLAAIVAILLTELGPRLVDTFDLAWPLQLFVVLVAVQAVFLVIDVPFEAWIDLRHDRRWGLSTQSGRTFVTDQVKGLVLTTVLATAALVPLYALIRTTEWWWLVGWLFFSALGVALGFLFPVVIAPIFNRFEPLDDQVLVERLREVARRSGVSIAGVLVADESRRSRRDNAYVSGLGATRRVVLYDTILEHPPELVEQVVAHELGHWRRHHIRQQIPVFVLTTLVAFVLLRLVAGWDGLSEWLGIDGLGDPASLPVLALGAQAAGLFTGLVTSWFARAHEREADLDALEVLRRPGDAEEMLRRLHVKNLADLDPGRLKRLRASHPPAAERMAFARRWAAANGRRGEPSSFTLA
jgi:STE24 endopeptidase